jgi:hypothetical protein
MSNFIPKRTLLCSYKNHVKLQAAYPKRAIVWDLQCPDELFYYIGRPLKKYSNSTVRAVFFNEIGVYTHDIENFPNLTRIK